MYVCVCVCVCVADYELNSFLVRDHKVSELYDGMSVAEHSYVDDHKQDVLGYDKRYVRLCVACVCICVSVCVRVCVCVCLNVLEYLCASTSYCEFTYLYV